MTTSQGGRPRAATPEAELQAVLLAKDHGIEEAARRTGFSARTIKRWATERGLIPRKNPAGHGAQPLMKGFSYTLVFDNPEALELFKRFVVMAEMGFGDQYTTDGDRVAEALRGVMERA